MGYPTPHRDSANNPGPVVVRHDGPGVPIARRLLFLLKPFIFPVLMAVPQLAAAVDALTDYLTRAAVRPDAVQLTLGTRRVLMFTRPGFSRLRAVLYFHGGGFLMGNPEMHSPMTRQIADRLCMPVYSLDYRKLRHGGVAPAVADAVAAYRDLIDRGYRQVVVMGDSAGGFLAGKVVEASLDGTCPLPAAFVGLSPWLDLWVGRNPQRSGWRDPLLSKRAFGRFARRLACDAVTFTGRTSITQLPGTGFPPTIFITARDELFEPDAFDLAATIRASGGVAAAHSFSNQIHDFASGLGLPAKLGANADNAMAFVFDFLQAAGAPGQLAGGQP